MKYRNLGRTTKTFYGVTFKPGEEKEVSGYINDPKFLMTDRDDVPKRVKTSLRNLQKQQTSKQMKQVIEKPEDKIEQKKSETKKDVKVEKTIETTKEETK